MALTKAQVREILSKAGVSAENMADAVESIIDGHVASIEALREDVETYKKDSESLKSVQKELENLRASVSGGDDWKKKYDDEKKAFDDFKIQVEQKEITENKKSMYRDILKSENIDEKRIDAILKVTDISSIEIEGDKLKDEKEIRESIKKEWSGFVVSQQQSGANVDNPPANGGVDKAAFDKMTLSEQMSFANKNPEKYAEFTK